LLGIPGVALALRIQPPTDRDPQPDDATSRIAPLAHSDTTVWDAFNNG
jgi:hypothetical protein